MTTNTIVKYPQINPLSYVKLFLVRFLASQLSKESEIKKDNEVKSVKDESIDACVVNSEKGEQTSIDG